MAYDGTVRFRAGEVKPVYAALTAASPATLTITAARVTLYDSAGAPAGGISGTACSGYDVGALAAPRAWQELDTTALPAGFYRLVFTITATGSDGNARTYEPELLIEVVAVP